MSSYQPRVPDCKNPNRTDAEAFLIWAFKEYQSFRSIYNRGIMLAATIQECLTAPTFTGQTAKPQLVILSSLSIYKVSVVPLNL